jgi:hypothetical protein
VGNPTQPEFKSAARDSNFNIRQELVRDDREAFRIMNAIEMVRQAADRLEYAARATSNQVVKADLFNMSAKYHCLARETAKKLADQLGQATDEVIE